MNYNKSGEMGVGTLIVFIAMLLVAAVAAGVLIQTASSLQEKSLATGQQSRSQISTNARVIEVSARDGRDGTLDEFFSIYKLSPGSDPMKLDHVLFAEATTNTTNNLKLKSHGECIHDVFNGYFTARNDDIELRTAEFTDPISADFGFSSSQTSEMMIGKVAIAIVFPESDGSIEPNRNNWTEAEKQYVINVTRDAMNWWRTVEPRANIRFVIETYNVDVSYDPIMNSSAFANHSRWVNESLDAMGVDAGSNPFVRARAFSNNLRERMNAHWGFIVFAADSSHSPFGGFADGYGGRAYINGPYTLICSDCGNTEATYAHEFAHIFGARDQYASSGCNCTWSGGYFNIEAQNCDASCLVNETSIMRGGTEMDSAFLSHTVDIFARAQMGLVDTNSNNLMDPIDILYEGRKGANVTQGHINSLANTDYTYNPVQSDVMGYFSKEYLQIGTNNVDGNLQRGDVIKVCHAAGRSIVEDDEIRLTFIPKIGSPTLTQFVTPDVMSLERMYVYP